MRYLFLTAALFLGTTAGCDSKPKGDPAACKTSAKDADACKACCSTAGANGHMWNGSECSCL